MENNELIQKLTAPLPNEAIKPHPTKTYLSSIKAIYVTERFNEVFGVGKWTQKVKVEHTNHETGMVVVHVTFEVPELNIYYESFGGNDNGGSSSKNFDLGDAYKGATTDALTKIGSYLGVGIDVFKGKYTASNQSQNNTSNKPQLPWLNIYKKGTKDLTPEMTDVYTRMKEGKLTSLADIRKEYAVNKVNAVTIEAWFKQLQKTA
ncbi:MAG: hypothetical protein KGV59_06180 [Tenacibaculum sp.]|nr:hypothetical protein [Tenacibaculum sp.]